MSKRRMIDSSLWVTKKFAKMPALARLMQIAMINLADDQGRLKADPLYLKAQVFPYEEIQAEQVSVWLNFMVVNGTILLYQADSEDYAQFCNWWEYQSLQYAQPSDYPAPEGWQDRIRFNGKANITLTHNWIKVDGEPIEDTCDATGKPLPFVDQLPRKNQGGRPSKKGKTADVVEVEKVATFPPTFPPGNVIKDQHQDQTEVKEETNNNMRAADTRVEPTPKADVVVGSALRDLVKEEAEWIPDFVGVDGVLSSLDDEAVMSLLGWLWLYNGFNQDDLHDRMSFVSRYSKRKPFAKIENPVGYMIRQAREHISAPLCEKHKQDVANALRERQEASP